MLTDNQKRVLPFSLTLFVIALDQITKLLIVLNIELYSAKYRFLGDFLVITHARNLNAAFGFGDDWPPVFKFIVLTIISTLFLVGLIVYCLRTDELSLFQRWVIAGIIGGGTGNIIDRIFRPEGVVDFIDVKFYGLLGYERWPTFNIADSCIVISTVLLFVSIILSKKGKKSE